MNCTAWRACVVIAIFGGTMACPAAEESTAARLGFVPGDSCFVVDFGAFEETLQVDERETASSVDLQYRWPDVVFAPAMPQYFGFSRLHLHSMSAEQWWQLRYLMFLAGAETDQLQRERLSHSAPQDDRQCSLVVVRSEFPFRTHNPFLRYNEDWYQRGRGRIAPGGSPYGPLYRITPGLYQSHVSSSRAVTLDWQDSTSVESLPVTFPAEVTFEVLEHKFPSMRCIPQAVRLPFGQAMILAYPAGTPEAVTAHRLNTCFYSLSGAGLFRHRQVINDSGERELVSSRLRTPQNGTPEP